MERDEQLRLKWRVDALDQWRKDIDGRVFGLEKQVAELVKADEIAAAVSEKMSQQQTLHLSQIQRRWALGFGVVGVLGSLAGVAALAFQVFS